MTKHVKKQSDSMTKKQINMERSPFHKTRNMTAPRNSKNLQTQVSKDIEDDFMKFARHFNGEHAPEDVDKVAKPLRHIINEFLNGHALERQCYDELYVIMLFYNPFENVHEDVRKCAVIGFVDHPETFTKLKPFRAVNDKQNTSKTIYQLEHFNKETFDKMNLKSLDREVLFNIDPSIYDDFEQVREHLQDQEQCEGMDFDNSYICMFNLNNYLDMLKDGVYVKENSTYSHDGFVVLFNPDDIYMFDRLIGRITWSYTAGNLEFEFNIESEEFFFETLINQTPQNVFDENIMHVSGFLTPQAKLEKRLELSNNEVERLNGELEKAKQRNAEIKAELDRLKKQ